MPQEAGGGCQCSGLNCDPNDPGDPDYDPTLYDYDHVFMYYACGDEDDEHHVLEKMVDWVSKTNLKDRILIIMLADFWTYHGPIELNSQMTNINACLLEFDNKGWRRVSDPTYLKLRNNDYKDVSMNDPQTLLNFLQFCLSKYNAYRFSLILRGHGSGIINGDCDTGQLFDKGYFLPLLPDFNDTQSGMLDPLPETLSVQAIKDALDYIKSNDNYLRNEKLGLIVFEACLMGNFDVYYILKDYTDYIIASEELMWYVGFDIKNIIEDWQSKAGYQTYISSLAESFVSKQGEFYIKENSNPQGIDELVNPGDVYNQTPYIGIAAINANYLENMAQLIEDFWRYEENLYLTNTLVCDDNNLNENYQYIDPLMQIRNEALQFGNASALAPYSEEAPQYFQFFDYYIDLYDFLEKYLNYWELAYNNNEISVEILEEKQNIVNPILNEFNRVVPFKWNRYDDDPSGLIDPSRILHTGKPHGISYFYPLTNINGEWGLGTDCLFSIFCADEDLILTYMNEVVDLYPNNDYISTIIRFWSKDLFCNLHSNPDD